MDNKIIWIAGGGLALGLVVLLGSRGGGGGAVQSGAPYSLMAQLNAGQTEVQLAGINAHTKATTDLYGMMGSLIQAGYQHDTQSAAIRAGVIANQINAATALQLDVQGNANRVSLATIGQGTAQIQANAAKSIAKTQAGAAVQVSQNNMTGNIISSLIGGVSRVATAFLI